MKTLSQAVAESNNIVFLGGAGVSTESGIPDFRGENGMYLKKYEYPPETILSHSFFLAHTDIFYEYYKANMIYGNAKPNEAHKALARLEQCGKLKGVITQNIDGLHQEAGSKNVYELHGSVMRNFCTVCGKPYTLDYILKADGVPKCSVCGAPIKPDVVLYEEPLNEKILAGAARIISEADVLIIGGTSMTVFPAASLYRYFSGSFFAIINKTPTPADRYADVVIHESIGSTLKELI